MDIHFIFSGSQNALGGGTTALKNLLRNSKGLNHNITLHYSSYASNLWDSFDNSISKVVHEGWKTYENRGNRYFDNSHGAFDFDRIEDGARVVFDASECVRQLTDRLARKKCKIYWHVQSPEHCLRRDLYRMVREFINIQKIHKLIFISRYNETIFKKDLLYKLLGRDIPSAVVHYGIPLTEGAVEASGQHVIYFGRYEAYKNPLFLEEISVDNRYVGTPQGCTKPVHVPPGKDLGWMSPSEAARYGDIFVFPSLNEAFGLAVIEMMSYGKIPICFESGAFPEIIDDGLNGFLIKPFDHKAAKKIITKLQNDENLRAQIKANAIQKARQFSISSFQESFFRELAN